MKKKSTLYLFPNLLGNQRFHEPWLPASVDKAVLEIDGLIAESPQGGRSFLNRFRTKKPPYEIPLALLNEHSKKEDLDFLLEPLVEGQSWGMVSDAGLPCVADPGANLVRRARQRGIQIKAFVGPSAIMLSLMLSGLPGNRFDFHGYIPKKNPERIRKIVEMERDSKKGKSTQIFIEAPYRNGATFQDLLTSLHSETLLCIAWDLTLPTQGVICQSVAVWKKSVSPNIDKKPCVFLVYAE